MHRPDEDDAEDHLDSPMEALAKRKKQGFDRVIDIPYEFDSDSRDTAIVRANLIDEGLST